MERLLSLSLVLLLTLGVAGCEIIGKIFKAGVWIGVILVLLIILIIWLISRIFR